MRRLISFILLCSLLVACLAGCKKTPVDDTSAKQKLIEQLRQDTGKDTETVEFTAELFADGALSTLLYSIDVKITDDNIFLNDVQYDNVKIVQSSELKYNWLTRSDETVTNDEYTEIIKKIESCKECYLLEAENAKSAPKKVAVHKIDNTYYFSSVYSDNVVLMIHYVKIEK